MFSTEKRDAYAATGRAHLKDSHRGRREPSPVVLETKIAGQFGTSHRQQIQVAGTTLKLQPHRLVFDEIVWGAKTLADTIDGMWARLVKRGQMRRDAERLRAMDDRLLRDIGLTRSEIESALRHGRIVRHRTVDQL